MAKNLRNGTDFPDISTAPSTAFRKAIVVAGANQAAAGIYGAPVADECEHSVYNLPSGNTVATLAMLRSGLIVADNPSSTSLEIPSEAALGYVRTAGKELRFQVERRGNGAFSVNFTAGGTPLVADNGVDISTVGKYFVVQYRTIGSADQWVCG